MDKSSWLTFWATLLADYMSLEAFRPILCSTRIADLFSVGIGLKELGGGSAAEMFEILPRD